MDKARRRLEGNCGWRGTGASRRNGSEGSTRKLTHRIGEQAAAALSVPFVAATPAATGTTAGRLHGLDAARGISMLLGMFAHGSLAYTINQIGWPVMDRSRWIGADLFFVIVYMFRLPAFFLTSGFFARLLYTRRGPATFVVNRTKRIVLPFLIALIPVNVAHYLVLRLIPGRSVPLESMALEPRHLWFLYYLSILLGAAFLIARQGTRLEGLMARLDRVLAKRIDSLALLLGLGLVTATLIPSDGITTPMGFVPDLSLLLFYAVFFGFGWMLHRQPILVTRLSEGNAKRWGIGFLALLAIAAILTLDASSKLSLVLLYLRGVFTWCIVFAFIGLFLRYFSTPQKVVGYLADASYWCYLVHLPFVVLFQLALARYPWPVLPKFFLVMLATLLVSLVSYHYGVRSTFLGDYLTGRRLRKD